MRECRNYFSISYERGQFEIINGIIGLSNNYLVGQYIYVAGSILNDGVYLLNDTLYTLDGSRDESFNGIVYGLSVPREFIELVNKIDKFTQSKEGQESNITSASFGIQSQSFGTDNNGVRAGWQTVFRNELHKYRRMTPDINIYGGDCNF